ncbi:hypothetical protein AUP68_14015 [Ilyonectria robusta]
MATPTDSDACSRSAGFVVYNNSSPESTYRLPRTGELHRGIVALARGGSPFLVQHCRTGELVLARRTFLREYGSLARVSHPHVARIRCVFDLEPQSILIQELLSLSLFELVPLSEVELASGLSQVCLQGVVKVVLDVGFEEGHMPTMPSYWDKEYRIAIVGLRMAELSDLGHEFFRDSARKGIPQVEVLLCDTSLQHVTPHTRCRSA